MDDEMINRLTPILLKHNPQTKIGAIIVLIELLQAMREPTEKMKHAKDKNGDEIHWGYSCNTCGGIKDAYYAMIDSIIK